MQNIRSKGTKPELVIFQALKKRKIYFAPHADTITGKPDLVFRRKKVAVFIDSDFWHGHSDRYPPPKSNTEYWEAKIARNRKRDAEVNAALSEVGWTVIRIWAYDIKHDLNGSIERILFAIGRSDTEISENSDVVEAGSDKDKVL